MSAMLKVKYSRLAIIAVLTVCTWAVFCTIAMGASLTDATQCAEAVAQMNAMQLLATISITSILALVVVVGFYFRSVASFQKETAAKLAEITVIIRDIERK